MTGHDNAGRNLWPRSTLIGQKPMTPANPTDPMSEGGEGYQTRVGAWMRDVFSAGGADVRTRIDRFYEEAFELGQALNYDPSRIAAIRDYVWGRPIGDAPQEMGGVMVTLASLAEAASIDMAVEGERELERIHRPEVRAKIMAKQASKNGLHTPLPTAAPPPPAQSEARELLGNDVQKVGAIIEANWPGAEWATQPGSNDPSTIIGREAQAYITRGPLNNLGIAEGEGILKEAGSIAAVGKTVTFGVLLDLIGRMAEALRAHGSGSVQPRPPSVAELEAALEVSRKLNDIYHAELLAIADRERPPSGNAAPLTAPEISGLVEEADAYANRWLSDRPRAAQQIRRLIVALSRTQSYPPSTPIEPWQIKQLIEQNVEVVAGIDEAVRAICAYADRRPGIRVVSVEEMVEIIDSIPAERSDANDLTLACIRFMAKSIHQRVYGPEARELK